ncbi:hypothetical protein [Blastococcus sp. SYSU D00820]
MTTTMSPDLDEILGRMRVGIDSPSPGPLLTIAASVLATPEPSGSLSDLVTRLAADDHVELSATALAVATLSLDTGLRRQVRRQIAERGHVLPRWLVQLDRAEPCDRAVEFSTVFREVDELVVGVVVPGGHPLTAVVRIDNEPFERADDGHVFWGPLESITGADAPGARSREVSPADARARIAAALHAKDALDRRLPSQRSEQMAAARPLIDWLLSRLPEGGHPSSRSISEADHDEIARQFLASPFGPSWRRSRSLVADMLDAGGCNGIGDPLMWSPRHVRRVLDSSTVFDDRTDAERAPDLLRDLIRYGHTERGVPPELTEKSLAQVEALADQFREEVREYYG